MTTLTPEYFVSRWSDPQSRPLVKGKLIDETGRCSAQGDVLRCAGFSEQQLRAIKQTTADRESARLLGISLAESMLIRIVNDSTGRPQDVFQAPEKVLGPHYKLWKAFARRIDQMSKEDWDRVVAAWTAAGTEAGYTSWEEARIAARDAARAAAREEAWEEARIAARASARDAARAAAREEARIAARASARDAARAAAREEARIAARASARDAARAAAREEARIAARASARDASWAAAVAAEMAAAAREAAGAEVGAAARAAASHASDEIIGWSKLEEPFFLKMFFDSPQAWVESIEEADGGAA